MNAGLLSNLPRHRAWALGLWCGGWSLVLLAAKFWLIGAYGNDTPFWDQWDAQAERLFSPWLAGNLRIESLLAPHNEHRILFTRLLAIVLVEINGRWSPLLEMCVNAVLHVLVVFSAALLLGRAAGVRVATPVVMATGALLYSIPFGWENSLLGFQSAFQLVVLFSLWALWFLQSSAFSRRWWIGVVFSVFAYFSLASGAIVAVAAACTTLFRLGGSRPRRVELLGMVLLLTLFVVGYAMTPVLPGHAYLRASSLWQFADATITAGAWPFDSDPMVLVRNAPLFFLVGVLVMQRAEAADRRWYIVAAGMWLLLQSLALAYGRASGMYAPRYFDLYGMALLVNAAALVNIAIPALRTPHRRAAFTALVVWAFVCVAAGERLASSPVLARNLATKREISLRQQHNLAAFLLRKDVVAMARLPMFDLPYPNARRLAEITSDPRLLAILPAQLQPAGPDSVPPGRLNVLVTWLLANWSTLLNAGFAVLAGSVALAVLPRLPGTRGQRPGSSRKPTEAAAAVPSG